MCRNIFYIKMSGNLVQLPFLKWAGGKRWLVEKHFDLLDVRFNRFIEPFLGSGAVFFRLAPKQSILCDINKQLIDTYIAIRDSWPLIEQYLYDHHVNHNKEYYYSIREKVFESPPEKAARFIYLNRTCWNGLYRVNLKGRFNVPIGTKTNVMLDSDNFEKVSLLLKNSVLVSGDFQVAIEQADAGDFVFVDPPYTVKHNFNGFIKYNESIFSWDDQIRLSKSVRLAKSRGAKVIVTNAYHESVKELYEGVGEFICLDRPSIISANKKFRGRCEEMVIKCF